MPKLVSNRWRISLLSLGEDSSCHLGIYNPLWGNETQALEKGINTAVLGIDAECQAGDQKFQVTFPGEWSQETWVQNGSEFPRGEKVSWTS